MKKAIIMYATFSGNTKEVAEIIQAELYKSDFSVDMFEIDDNSLAPELKKYDYIFFGTFSWDKGATPDFVKDFVADIGYKPENVYVFGTGETQFGEQYYCLATKKLAKFYQSKEEPLIIEQSPRGSQETKVKEWAQRIIKNN